MFFTTCASHNLCFSQAVIFITCASHNLCFSQAVVFTSCDFHNLRFSQPVLLTTCASHNLCFSQPVIFTTCAFHNPCFSQPVLFTTCAFHNLYLSQKGDMCRTSKIMLLQPFCCHARTVALFWNYVRHCVMSAFSYTKHTIIERYSIQLVPCVSKLLCTTAHRNATLERIMSHFKPYPILFCVIYT